MKDIIESAFLISSGYADKGAGVSATDSDDKNAFFPDWSNITFRDITCIGSKQAVEIQGLKGKPVHNILFDNVTIIGNKNGIKMEWAEDIKFQNCNINPKPMPITDYKKIKNVLYNGKDPDAAESPSLNPMRSSSPRGLPLIMYGSGMNPSLRSHKQVISCSKKIPPVHCIPVFSG